MFELSVVLPHAQGIGDLYGRGNIVGPFPLEVILYRVVDVSRTERLVGRHLWRLRPRNAPVTTVSPLLAAVVELSAVANVIGWLWASRWL